MKNKNLLFTFAILIGSLTAFFAPEYFVSVGEFQTKQLILPLLMLIMFGMGTHLSIASLIDVWKTPRALGIGIGAQFVLMPLVGYLLAVFTQLPAEVAAGIILVGCSPSGLASNVMCFIAKANLALSLTLTTVATLIAPVLTPMLMKFYANEFVPVDAWAMFISMLKLVVLPVALGIVFNLFLSKRMPWLARLMPLLSMLGIIVIVAIIIANGQQALASMGLILVLAVLLHNLCGFAFGYLLAKASKLDEPSARTLAFEVGMQNSGLASGIALTMGKVSTMGLAAALFSSLQNISGSILASYWASKNIKAEYSAAARC